MAAGTMEEGPQPPGGPRGPYSLARRWALGVMVAAVWVGQPNQAAAATRLPGSEGPDQAAATRLPGSQTSEVESLRRANRTLRMELEVAEAGEPYLVLDLPGGTLVLKSHGAVLREFPVRNARARRLGVSALFRVGMQPLDTLWAGGRLLPARRLQRRVILTDTVAPPDPSGSVSFIPPTPEEETPTPPSFRIRYQDGLSLLVWAVAEGDEARGGAASPGHSPLARLMNWIRRKPWLRDPLRLDLTLPREEAGALYRAFLDGTPLLVLGRWPVAREPA